MISYRSRVRQITEALLTVAQLEGWVMSMSGEILFENALRSDRCHDAGWDRGTCT